MRRVVWLLLICSLLGAPLHGAENPPKPLVAGVKNLRAVAAIPAGKVYVAAGGEAARDGDGVVLVIEDGKAMPFAAGLDEPSGIGAFADALFVVDRNRVWRIDRAGKARVHAAAAAFPAPPRSLSGLAVDELGLLYVTDAGDSKGDGAAVYRVDPRGRVTLVSDAKRAPALKSPRGLVMDGMSFLLVLDGSSGELLRIKVADGTAVKLADGFGTGGGLAWDRHGRLFLADGKAGRVSVVPRPGEKPVALSSRFESIAGLALDPSGKSILVADPKAGTLTALPAAVPGQRVDETPLPIETAVAFPDLKWTGWKAEVKGKPVPLRPLVLTHAGDGSNRVFVATEHGVIHVFPNEQKAERTQVFLDIQDRVFYDDNQNEEGFLGLAFHPKYKDNGEFFVFYTVRKPKLTNVLSRFRVSKDDPNRADPASEEELLRITTPFWNHDGGTLCFGPDGYLYVAVGDGGKADDPFNHGQDLSKIFGKVLRLDVDHKDKDRPYAIPKDNPFVDKAGARPEIWAFGLRNPWRMAFDRKTGKLWTSDVGQNLYEEIDILVAGGNYGWSIREGLHPFGANGSGPRKDLIDPIWEYHHDTGKSLTGGTVYRGKRLPELEGHYLYADYVNPRIWALRYDEGKGRVVANRPIPDPNVPVMSFGEDEAGEVYFMTYSPTGKGIYWFVRAKGGKDKD
ncbi:MAG TPA: PQQ-dependent sugar dehydrogenase [Gemmataceae bacterium]|nr:PQQ-dependent sugar dehydrogenase [Gemmataceae bacterium]